MDTLGKYQLVEKIGIGGFGEVYKGYDPLIKRYVAIKTCAVTTEDVRARFFQEAEIAGNLHHRNVTTVYDFGVQDDLPFLVQEYLSGEDLDRKIKRKDELSVADKLAILVQVARGLAFAHANHVIHRDIKPANIRVLEDGTAKIMDFGIAKLAQVESGLTQTGMTIGTAAYLSPEQVRGGHLDVRTDIFSFGILAYELLAYKRPFEGRDLSAVTYQVAHAEPRQLGELAPSAPAMLVKIVQRCMNKLPANRYSDGGELARELERLQGQLSARVGSEDNRTLPLHRDHLAKPENFDVTIKASTDRQPVPAAASQIRRTPSGPSGMPAPGPAPVSRPDLPLHATPSPVGGMVSVDPSLMQRREPGSGGVSELELYSGQRPATTGGFTASARWTSNLPLPLPWLIVIGLLAFSALLIGLLLGRGNAPAPISTAATSGPSSSSPPASPPSSTSTASQTAPPKNPATSTTTPPSAPAASQPAPATQTPPPTAPAPPESQPAADGVVVVRKPGWTPAMVVILGKKAYRLDVDRRLTLEPGQYTLTFQLDESGYRASVSSRVTVISGKDTVVQPPIGQPGLLSVRPRPSRPQGEVLVDQQSQGGSPLSRLRLGPGTHQLEIRRRDGAGTPISRSITIESGKETIVTFDLEQNNAQVVVK